MSLRPVEDRDLPAIAAIHKAQFSTHFIGQYSCRVIADYYRSFLSQSIFLVHETTTELDGFVLGGRLMDLSNCARVFLRRHWLCCLWDTLLRPRLWLDAPRRAMSYIIPVRTGSNGCDEPPEPFNMAILSIAVAEEARGKGVAAALLGAFEQEIMDRVDVYGLSVAKDNPRAIRFYHKMGFELQQETPVSFVFQKRLRPASTA